MTPCYLFSSIVTTKAQALTKVEIPENLLILFAGIRKGCVFVDTAPKPARKYEPGAAPVQFPRIRWPRSHCHH